MKQENQIELYQTESETNKEIFHTLIRQFTEHWTVIEPEFIAYFSENYANRAGLSGFCLLWLHLMAHVHTINFREVG